MAQSDSRSRLLVVFALGAVWIVIVAARISYLQLFEYREYLERAHRQQDRLVEISPMRGPIYDRNGRELAMSIPVDSCFADPQEITNPDSTAHALARILNMSVEEIAAKLSSSRSFVWIARKITPKQTARIRALDLPGIYFQKENKRFYPEHSLAATVLGYVDVDEHGLGGIEYSLDKDIRGRPGRMLVLADARRRWVDRSEAPADRGATVSLTIDQTIQYIAEDALVHGIERTHSQGGSVVVQNPNTGQLLAVANWPSFDSNNAHDYPPQDMIDRVVSSAYEPGSIFKTILFSSAIQDGMLQPAELIDCQMGSIVVAGRLIHDWHPFGILTAEQVLVHSSDVGSIKIALRLGASKYYQYIRSFGFGRLTGIKLPGENRGLLRPVEDWTPSSIGSIAIGQEISVTPVQMITAESAIANGGILNKPQIIRQVVKNGQVLLQGNSDPRRIIDEKTAATVRGIMEQVVLEGTGRPAQPFGYTAAGKTGTAQKIDPATGRYSHTQYNASFIGYAPVNNPVVTILVNLDSPMVGSHEGGPSAGPVFKEVAERVLAYLNVPHNMPLPNVQKASLREKKKAFAEAAEFAKEQKAAERAAVQSASHASVPIETVPVSSTVAIAEGEAVVVPKFAGQSVRNVIEACSRLGLTPVLIGDGIAVDQIPDAGTKVLPGTKVTVHFGRTSDAAAENPAADQP